MLVSWVSCLFLVLCQSLDLCLHSIHPHNRRLLSGMTPGRHTLFWLSITFCCQWPGNSRYIREKSKLFAFHDRYSMSQLTEIVAFGKYNWDTYAIVNIHIYMFLNHIPICFHMFLQEMADSPSLLPLLMHTKRHFTRIVPTHMHVKGQGERQHHGVQRQEKQTQPPRHCDSPSPRWKRTCPSASASQSAALQLSFFQSHLRYLPVATRKGRSWGRSSWQAELWEGICSR